MLVLCWLCVMARWTCTNALAGQRDAPEFDAAHATDRASVAVNAVAAAIAIPHGDTRAGRGSTKKSASSTQGSTHSQEPTAAAVAGTINWRRFCERRGWPHAAPAPAEADAVSSTTDMVAGVHAGVGMGMGTGANVAGRTGAYPESRSAHNGARGGGGVSSGAVSVSDRDRAAARTKVLAALRVFRQAAFARYVSKLQRTVHRGYSSNSLGGRSGASATPPAHLLLMLTGIRLLAVDAVTWMGRSSSYPPQLDTLRLPLPQLQQQQQQQQQQQRGLSCNREASDTAGGCDASDVSDRGHNGGLAWRGCAPRARADIPPQEAAEGFRYVARVPRGAEHSRDSTRVVGAWHNPRPSSWVSQPQPPRRWSLYASDISLLRDLEAGEFADVVRVLRREYRPRIGVDGEADHDHEVGMKQTRKVQKKKHTEAGAGSQYRHDGCQSGDSQRATTIGVPHHQHLLLQHSVFTHLAHAVRFYSNDAPRHSSLLAQCVILTYTSVLSSNILAKQEFARCV